MLFKTLVSALGLALAAAAALVTVARFTAATPFDLPTEVAPGEWSGSR